MARLRQEKSFNMGWCLDCHRTSDVVIHSTKQVMKEMLAGVTKAVSGALGDLGKGVKDLGKEGTQQLEKATKGVTDLFKKKK
jgi:hypothetical protein